MPRSNKRKADSEEGTNKHAAYLCGVVDCKFHDTIENVLSQPAERLKDHAGGFLSCQALS